MKKLKKFKLLLFLTLICSFFTLNTKVHAASATVEFSSNSTVSIGEQITVTMYITNVNDTNGGIVSAGGNLSFDSSYLEYVSATGVTTPYAFQINPSANYKLAGLDTSLASGITSKTKVFTFVFKAKKIGSTTVTLTNATLTDTAQKVTTSVSPKSITIEEAKPKSNDATLKALSVSGQTLSPSFSASTTSYTVNVPATVSSVTINATANHSAAKVSGTGKVNLSSDTTNATVKVTAEDGTTKNYTVTINREKATPTPDPTPTPTPDDKSSDATLKSLYIGGYTLTPTFKSSVTTYSIRVGNAVKSLSVKAEPTDSKATVSVSGNSGWVVGNNTMTIKVTAEDGTINNYVVNVNRAAASSSTTKPVQKSTDNYLKNLVINSPHETSITFDKNITNYNITVANDVSKLDFTAEKSDSKATISITGDGLLSTDKINIIEIKVAAEDGSTRVYTLNVTRSVMKSNAYLKELNIKNGKISPKFLPETLSYEVNVGSKVDKLEITAIASDSTSKVEILGNANLKEGNNSVLIKVTDKNNFTQIYSLNVIKEKSKVGIFGFGPLHFVLLLIILIALIALVIILFNLLRKKKNEPKTRVANIKKENSTSQTAPIIEFKPEFNFGSKNSSDDDMVHGNMDQNREYINLQENTPNKTVNDDIYEGKVPYNIFDEVVTKDELYDAFNEAKETRDASKLKMLLEQEKLNRKKQELKEKEQEKNNDWR